MDLPGGVFLFEKSSSIQFIFFLDGCSGYSNEPPPNPPSGYANEPTDKVPQSNITRFPGRPVIPQTDGYLNEGPVVVRDTLDYKFEPTDGTRKINKICQN